MTSKTVFSNGVSGIPRTQHSSKEDIKITNRRNEKFVVFGDWLTRSEEDTGGIELERGPRLGARMPGAVKMPVIQQRLCLGI